MKKVLLALCAGFALCASAEVFEKGTAFTYNFGPDFQYFDGKDAVAEKNENWPTSMMAYGCSFGEDGARVYGTAAIWFNSAANQPTTVEAAAEVIPCVPDPWNPGDYALQLHATNWWGYGNFNFALPFTDDLCRVRIIFRCDIEGTAEFDNANGILFRLTDTALQGNTMECVGPNTEIKLPSFWENTGYRVVDLYTDQLDGKVYFAMTYMPGGFTCVNESTGPKPITYLEEVSIVPVKYLEGDTHESGDFEVNVVAERPDLVEVEGINTSIKEVNAAVKAGNAIYDMQGRRVANATKGLYIINGKKALVK